MKVVIAGSRTIDDYEAVCRAIEGSGFTIDLVISGGAKGVDMLGVRWAKENKIQHCLFPPMWHELGKRAGMVRNRWMVKVADGVIVVWDGQSRGSGNTIICAEDLKKHLFITNSEGFMLSERSGVTDAD